MSEEWQSNVQWDTKRYLGQYGDGVTTDTHRTEEGAHAVCRALELEGMGCMGEHYPIQTWVIRVGDDNPILEAIRKTRGVKLREVQQIFNKQITEETQ